jgi:3-dehydroquinate synthase
MGQNIIFTNDVGSALDSILDNKDYNRLFVLADENTARLVLPAVGSKCLNNARVITIGAGDVSKTLDTLTTVWQQLDEGGATRNSIVVNIGGGVVTDLGGFAAATFKRGIRFINCPTTLLSAVDAAVGGKTGINFNGLKNEIGAFSEATDVIISTCFFHTLPVSEVKSGFAEMLKHAMLSNHSSFAKLLDFDFSKINYDQLLELLKTSVKVKEDIVAQDPHEKGLRRALNLGHTAGHAFESTALNRKKPVAHGYAVAWGLVVETVLSHMRYAFPSADLENLASFVTENYGAFYITCDDYDALLDLMRHDKKSANGEINCTMLAACGDVKINNTVSDDDMKTALDIYRDLMHI